VFGSAKAAVIPFSLERSVFAIADRVGEVHENFEGGKRFGGKRRS